MNKINFSFVLLNKNIEGKYSIYLQLIQSRKIKRINLNFNVTLTDFDKKKQRVKKNCYNSFNINLVLDNITNKINNIFFENSLKGRFIRTEDLLNEIFEKEEKEHITYKKFVYDYIEKNKHKYKKGTIKIFKTKADKLNRLHNDILLKDIDLTFLENYKNELLKVNNENTTYVDLRIIKKFVRIGIKNKIINDNPFNDFKIKTFEGNRDFLTKTEFLKLHEYYQNTKNLKHKNVLQYFLFACLTGLRFSDICGLLYENIQDNIIYINMQKNGKFLSVPMCSSATHFIDKNKKSGFVFNTISNQKTNDYLKEIAQILEINKNVTFHVARHTFATLNISLGTNIEVISKLLGHASIKTTQIYAKITDNVKIQAVNKLESVFN